MVRLLAAVHVQDHLCPHAVPCAAAAPVVCVLHNRYILELLKADLKPRDIMTYKAFENAMVTVMATGVCGVRQQLRTVTHSDAHAVAQLPA